MNFLPCHYKITLKSWTSHRNLLLRGGLCAQAYCNEWECVTSECGELAIPLPELCLGVLSHRGCALFWYSKERRMMSRADFSPPKLVPLTTIVSLNQTKPESVILFFLRFFFLFKKTLLTFEPGFLGYNEIKL